VRSVSAICSDCTGLRVPVHSHKVIFDRDFGHSR
jgi:hypothetical protein